MLDLVGKGNLGSHVLVVKVLDEFGSEVKWWDM